MRLLTAKGLEKSYGDRLVLRGIDLAVDAGDRLGLVGANGSGKSTLLCVLAGEQNADAGQYTITGSVGLVRQQPHLVGPTVGDDAALAIAWHTNLLAAYQTALDRQQFTQASELQAKLDHEGWDIAHRVDALLERLQAPPKTALVKHLSGGEQRRVALAMALLQAPDLLLLDEPTNHLDASTVEWLQSYLLGYRGAMVLVTHDRYLLEAVAERIVEVEDGISNTYEGSYADYLLASAERRAALQRAQDRRLTLIAREAEWASRSPAARGTKQRARLKRLEALQAERPFTLQDPMKLNLRTGIRIGKSVLDAQGIAKRYGQRTLFSGFDLHLMAGDRVGIMGPNGAGKSTLLRLLVGLEPPDAGQVLRAPRVKVAVLDQARSGLDSTDTVFEAAGGGNSHVTLGDATLHVASFLKRFLFSRQRFDQRVATLSGGERARLLLAKLMLQGCNLLALDEPTNDLDLSTLRVLEEALLSFDGAVLVITHDRAFLDRVCTRVLVFDDGIQPYASRTQYLRAVANRPQAEKAVAAKPPKPKPTKAANLSYKEQRELDTLPDHIETLENQQIDLETQLADPTLYRERPHQVAELNQQFIALTTQIANAYDRLEALLAQSE